MVVTPKTQSLNPVVRKAGSETVEVADSLERIKLGRMTEVKHRKADVQPGVHARAGLATKTPARLRLPRTGPPRPTPHTARSQHSIIIKPDVGSWRPRIRVSKTAGVLCRLLHGASGSGRGGARPWRRFKAPLPPPPCPHLLTSSMSPVVTTGNVPDLPKSAPGTHLPQQGSTALRLWTWCRKGRCFPQAWRGFANHR